MSRKKWELDRRTFLKCSLGGAGTLMGLPLLNVMIPSMNRAYAAGTGAKRFCAVMTPLGVQEDKWFPGNAEGIHYDNNWALAANLAALNPYKSYVTQFNGVDYFRGDPMNGGAHANGTSMFLTCKQLAQGTQAKTGKSMDQYISDYLKTQAGMATPKASLQLASDNYGVGDGVSSDCPRALSWKDETTILPNINNPRQIFDELFAGTNPNASAADAYQRQKNQKSILDFVWPSAQSLMTKLGTEDKYKMQAYLSGIEGLQAKINQNPVAQPSGCVQPNQPQAMTNESVQGDFVAHIRLMYDLMFYALQCDRTRVATYMVGPEAHYKNYYDIITTNIAPGVRSRLNQDMHSLSHLYDDADPTIRFECREALGQINKLQINLLSEFVAKLASTAEGAGNMLDSTLIYYGSALRNPAHHGQYNSAVMLIGKGGGVRGNSYQRFGGGDKDASMSVLHTEIMKRYGMTNMSSANYGLNPGEDPNGNHRKVVINLG